MSKVGAVSRGLYAVIAFLINAALRVGLNTSLAVAIAVTIYAAATFSFEALKERKEVLELLYWRDTKKSAIALSLTLLAVFILGK
ncbi:hypothetical protein GCK32_021468 [Trichostrongylus colubriformis]|uniref:Reticulon domain-containing protein n=1 Tax=Trichostrongylus colubriformis TaxID=6319 RepID=A0AAN8FIM1_TRICO